MTSNTAYGRAYNATTTQAARWVRHNRPDVWQHLHQLVRREHGLEPQPKRGRPPKTQDHDPI